MKQIILVFTFFVFCIANSQAQNWRTVLLNDSTYYASSLGNTNNNHLLKIIWIDSVSQNGTDSIFYFYKSFREMLGSSCIDSNAATWLGSNFIRGSNGDELYFNYNGDTILIKTSAQQGSSWIIAKNGVIEYLASVIQTGIQLIDDVNDSVKIISLQAYSNGAQINDSYNNTQLVISKNHGWVKTLDMYMFPHCNIPPGNYGATTDNSQHFRLDHSIKNIDLLYSGDFATKYQPGNEWISISSTANHQPFFTDPFHATYIYDSVINVVQNSTNSITATLQRQVVDKALNSWGPNGFTWSYTYHSNITTVVANTNTPLPTIKLTDTLLPEYNWRLQYLNTDNDDHYFRRFYVDTTCGNNHFIIQSRDLYTCYVDPPNGLIRDTNNCIKVTPGGLCQGYTTRWDYMEGFGYSYVYEYSSIDNSDYSCNETLYSYIKLGSCTIGTKINLSALAIDEVTKENNIVIFPNPAQNILNIQGINTSANIDIIDLTGRKVFSTKYESQHPIDISSLQNGTYIVRVITNKMIKNEKLIIVK